MSQSMTEHHNHYSFTTVEQCYALSPSSSSSFDRIRLRKIDRREAALSATAKSRKHKQKQQRYQHDQVEEYDCNDSEVYIVQCTADVGGHSNTLCSYAVADTSISSYVAADAAQVTAVDDIEAYEEQEEEEQQQQYIIEKCQNAQSAGCLCSSASAGAECVVDTIFSSIYNKSALAAEEVNDDTGSQQGISDSGSHSVSDSPVETYLQDILHGVQEGECDIDNVVLDVDEGAEHDAECRDVDQQQQTKASILAATIRVALDCYPHTMHPFLRMEDERIMAGFVAQQKHMDYCLRMNSEMAQSPDHSVMAVKMLLNEAHMHHIRTVKLRLASPAYCGANPESIAQHVALVHRQWVFLAMEAADGLTPEYCGYLPRRLSAMCLFNPHSDHRVYGENETYRAELRQRQQATLAELQRQKEAGSNGLFLDPQLEC